MAEIKINPLFNLHEKYRKVIIINTYRSDPDAVAQAARIVADGGTVVDFAFMNLVISTLKSMGIYGNNKLLANANFGVKINPSTGALSKQYDVSGNNNDAVQATGASQPIWSLVNGRGVITYNGVNDWLDCGNVLNPALDSYTTLTRFKFNALINTQFLLSKAVAAGSTSIGFTIFYLSAGSLGVRVNGNNTTSQRASQSISFNSNLSSQLIMVIDRGINKVIGYLNGSNTGWVAGGGGPTSDSITGFGSIANTSNLLTGQVAAGSYTNGQINSSTIFSNALTQSQITQLYNLGL